MREKFQPLAAILEEIVKGLNRFDLVKHMKDYPQEFRVLFCPSSLLHWSYDLMVQYMEVKWKPDGSNMKMKEMALYKIFLDFLQMTYYDGKSVFSMW